MPKMERGEKYTILIVIYKNNNNNNDNKNKCFSKMRSSQTINKASPEPFISACPKGPPQNTSNLSPLTDRPELLQDKFQLQNLSFLHLRTCLSELIGDVGYFLRSFLEL